jgi:hypothetical protein
MPHPRTLPPRRGPLAVLFALLAAPLAIAADDVNELSRNLITLRGEVEALNSELELTREEQRSGLVGLNQQKAELEAQLNRQEQATREARERLAKHAEQTASAGVAGETLKPVLLAAIANLRAYLTGALPFKSDERLVALDEIKLQIENGSLLPHRAANRLWAFVEDEFRITRETGLYKQTVVIGNEKVLADVAKVGSVMLFYKAQDGRVGVAHRDAGAWRYRPIADAADRERVLALFDSLGKQIRQGYFELPPALDLRAGG